MNLTHTLENVFGLTSIMLVMWLGYAMNQLAAAAAANNKKIFHDDGVLTLSLMAAACLCGAITALLRRYNARLPRSPQGDVAVGGEK